MFAMNKEDWRTALTEYAEAVERGDVIPPWEYASRCYRLRQRGLSERLTADLRHSDDARLLREIEGLGPDQLRQLNAAHAATVAP